MSPTPEFTWLVLTCIATALMWLPYILQLISQMGVAGALMDGTGEHPHEAPWAQRAKRAHYNAVENLVVFAPLAILVAALGASSPTTSAAAAVFFVARLIHYVVYVAALPVVRTLAFAVGVVCQLVLAFAVLGAL